MVVDTEKTEEEKKEKLDFPPSSSSLSLSSNYGNQFLNLFFNTSLVGNAKELADTEINSLLDVEIQQETPIVQSAPLLYVLVSVIPEQTTPTPLTTPLPTPPISSKAPTITTTVSAYTTSSFFNDCANLESKIEALAPRLITSEALKSNQIEGIVRDKSHSYLDHDKHHDLYDALVNSILLDEAIASGDVNVDKVLRKRDRDDDQEPTAGSDQGKKKQRKGKDYEPSK
ncbi:hypothetical protein Tco_0139959, partial [Tanacetum coccineum]